MEADFKEKVLLSSLSPSTATIHDTSTSTFATLKNVFEQFRFVDFAPLPFQQLRALDGISPDDYEVPHLYIEKCMNV